MKRYVLSLSLILSALLGLGPSTVHADHGSAHTLVPIGSDYRQDTLELFARAAAERDSNGTVDLLVLPITYGTDAYHTSNGERQKNLDLADDRRGQIETACDAVKTPAQTCRAVLAPVLIRPDAYLQGNLDLFVPDLDGMYILGGDQTVGMRVVANTPFEDSMTNAFSLGGVVSGNSAGAAVQSRNMINGYVGNNGPENGFQQGAVDIWAYNGPADDTRGLRFGISNAILEQHTFQRGRTARMINTAFTTGLLGIGLDAGTGAAITDEATLADVTGATSAIVADLETYGATGSFAGPTNSLTIHGLVTHLIPPGDFGYDLVQDEPLVGGQALPAPSVATRTFDALHLPAGHGPLLLAGDLRGDPSGSVAQRFVALSEGSSARLVVLCIGYPRSNVAKADAKALAAALQAQVTSPVQWYVVDSKMDSPAVQAAIANATGILLTAPDQSLVLDALGSQPAITSAIQNRWAGGRTLLADNAAAAALAQAVSVDPPPTSASLEDDSMGDFLLGGVTLHPGLNWLPGVVVEPRMVMDRHWGRAYSQLYHAPSLLALGVDVDTAIEFTASGALVWGRNTVTVLDGRFASYGVGSNGALSERYVLMDTYVEGDGISP